MSAVEAFLAAAILMGVALGAAAALDFYIKFSVDRDWPAVAAGAPIFVVIWIVIFLTFWLGTAP